MSDEELICPVCDRVLESPPRDWSICPHCWCEFSGEGGADAQSGLPIAEYREKFRRGDFDQRNREYRATLDESLREQKP